MTMNTTKKPLDNLKVRQAINVAIDKSSLQTAGGGSQLAKSGQHHHASDAAWLD